MSSAARVSYIVVEESTEYYSPVIRGPLPQVSCDWLTRCRAVIGQEVRAQLPNIDPARSKESYLVVSRDAVSLLNILATLGYRIVGQSGGSYGGGYFKTMWTLASP